MGTISRARANCPRRTRKKTSSHYLSWWRQTQTKILSIMRGAIWDHRVDNSLGWVRGLMGSVGKDGKRTFYKRLMQIQIYLPLIYSTTRLISNGLPSISCQSLARIHDRGRTMRWQRGKGRDTLFRTKLSTEIVGQNLHVSHRIA